MLENSSKPSPIPVVWPKRVGFALLAIIWVIIVYAISTILMIAVFRLLSFIGVPLAGLSNNVLAFVSNALVWLIMLPTLLLPLRRWGLLDNLKQRLGLKRLLSWSDIGLALVAIIPYLLLSGLFSSLAQSFLPGFDGNQAQDVGFSELANRSELLLAFVALVIAAPLIEEIIFRGFLFSRLKKHLGIVLGVLFTSLTFAALHLQINVGIDVFALSLVLCTLRVVTGSIWAGVLLHMTKNGVAFFILFVLPMIQ